jgi:hypothetical protein
MLHKKHLSGA